MALINPELAAQVINLQKINASFVDYQNQILKKRQEMIDALEKAGVMSNEPTDIEIAALAQIGHIAIIHMTQQLQKRNTEAFLKNLLGENIDLENLHGQPSPIM